ncbi:hypothetical protein LTS17_006119 [Exophiala oligosperma]
MQCLARRPPSIKALLNININSLHVCRHQRHQFSTSRQLLQQLRQVPFLPSWTQDVFEREAYIPSTPARLPRSAEHIPPACLKWFIHDNDPDFVLTTSTSKATSHDGGTGVDEIVHHPTSSELRTSFWSDYESTVVPLEITSKNDQKGRDENEETFDRIEAPLKVLLAHLSRPTSTKSQTQQPDHDGRSMSIYLAQCDLTSLPPSVAGDIPTPLPLINPNGSSRSSSNSTSSRPSSSTPGRSHDPKRTSKGIIKGDIYASSLWLGRPPTYTPLHRDPNPNLFVQLAGRKVFRLLPPEVGGALFEDVQNGISHSRRPHVQSSSSTIRGEEMMVGPEKRALHDAIWSEGSQYSDIIPAYGLETEVKMGDALFIPKGWWHSVKGIGQGVTASVNWWFR